MTPPVVERPATEHARPSQAAERTRAAMGYAATQPPPALPQGDAMGTPTVPVARPTRSEQWAATRRRIRELRRALRDAEVLGAGLWAAMDAGERDVAANTYAAEVVAARTPAG